MTEMDEQTGPQHRMATKDGVSNTAGMSSAASATDSAASTSRPGQANLRSRRTAKYANKSTMTSEGDGGFGGFGGFSAGFGFFHSRDDDVNSWSLAACCCSKLFWLLLLLLVPLAVFTVDRLIQSDPSTDSSVLLDFRMKLEPNPNALVYIWSVLRQPVDFFRFLLLDALPYLFSLLAAIFRSSTPLSSDRSTGRFNEFVPDFKPATSGKLRFE